MKVLSYWLKKQLTGSLILLLAFPLAEIASAMPQQALTERQQQSTSATDGAALQPAPLPEAPTANGRSGADQQQQSSPNNQQPNGANKPVGTAAAPAETTSGIAASRPAGAVIAPAKQRRARAILIRVSIVVAAAVAVGAVVALSKSSSGRPN